ncbi:MAG: EAL domain-containing response regulator [Bacilli bacterium]|nr:EAL domain-containing response regulator [Bacilli bacterium]
MTSPFGANNDIRHRLLIVDDEEINRDILCAMLEEEYDTVCAENGEEALRILTTGEASFSLVLLDLNMPVMDGFTFLKKKLEIDALNDLPVIVLTSEVKMEVESLHLGAIDFIKKPYESPEIIRARIYRIVELFEGARTIQLTSIDPATGLYTKEYFDLYAEGKKNSGIPMDMVTIHVANFVLAEELFGHSLIAKSLHSIGRYLQDVGGATGAIATRASHDYFYYFGPHQEQYEEFLRGIDAVLEKLPHGNRLRVELGIYPNVDPSLDLADAFSWSRDALTSDLGDHTKRVHFRDAALHAKTLYEERLVQEFEESLRKREFKVYFQPKYDITGDKPVLAGAEALVRWVHPEFGMISPGVFIPLFEKNGLIRHLDRFVYEETVRVIARLRDECGITLPISANVSRVDAFDPELGAFFLELTKRYGVEPKLLHLELTETAFAENMNALIDIVHALRESGFVIEMDDFGSGYSSLNLLSDLPFDVLKIDGGFIRKMHKSSKNELILKSIVEIAKFLQVRAIAEGVETKEQVDALREFGCELIQGYYFSKPLPEEDFVLRAKGER